MMLGNWNLKSAAAKHAVGCVLQTAHVLAHVRAPRLQATRTRPKENNIPMNTCGAFDTYYSLFDCPASFLAMGN